jgi:hypothetical protein
MHALTFEEEVAMDDFEVRVSKEGERNISVF